MLLLCSFVPVLFLASLVYKVLLSAKDSMLLYELKITINIEIHLAINRMCWANCSKSGEALYRKYKKSAKQTVSIALEYSEAH